MQKVSLDKTWNQLLDLPIGNTMYWIEKCQIPIGTLYPVESYPLLEDGKRNIPNSDIVTIPFDPVETPFTSRYAMNMLFLGDSGDGKSLIMKLIWYFLDLAGFNSLYIDSKSTDSGRAKWAWHNSPRLPPYTEPAGVPLVHYMPAWAWNPKDPLAHNFRVYSHNLKEMNNMEMWQGLGMTELPASKVAKIIKQLREPTFEKIRKELYCMSREELSPSSYENAIRTLQNVEDYMIASDQFPELNLINEWSRGNNICVSYNNISKILMTFDIGFLIKKVANYYYDRKLKYPTMFIFDDSFVYAKKFDFVKYNFAVEEMMKIGNLYRSLGMYNITALQSVSIIDEAVAETYGIKLISPKFSAPDSLTNIGVPKKAINYLKNAGQDDGLVLDTKNHLLQWILIDKDKQVVPFFPFTPPCNHFKEVYFEKEAET